MTDGVRKDDIYQEGFPAICEKMKNVPDQELVENVTGILVISS